MSGGGGGGSLNSVFYAETYHPIQAGSIDGTDILPHDNAVYRALLCYNAALYDPFGDPKVIGDPYCTLFVARLSHQTTEDALRKAMSQYGRVKNLRLVRHIVTGASRGYAFVEFETEKEMRRAYKDAHHTTIDNSEIIVDYNRQQLMPGWIPRRLGGGLGGKKESGQLRFGGRERPFRAPLRQIPHDDLKRLGIPPPPEGRYMSRFQVPSPPRRKRSRLEAEDFDYHDKPRASSHCDERSLSPDRSQSGSRSVKNEDRHRKHHRHDRHEMSNQGERSHWERGGGGRDERSLSPDRSQSGSRSGKNEDRHHKHQRLDRHEMSNYGERSRWEREGGGRRRHRDSNRHGRGRPGEEDLYED